VGFLKRLRGERSPAQAPLAPVPPSPPPTPAATPEPVREVRQRLLKPNVPPDWIERDLWRTWARPYSAVSGESFYAEELGALTGPPRPKGYLVPVGVTLCREPENPYGSNAIRVEIGGAHVGYIAKEQAEGMAPLMDGLECSECQIAGIVRGGSTEHPNVGVMLWGTRRLSDAPSFSFKMRGVPRWPPDADEGRE
jgi:HIRAN domain.